MPHRPTGIGVITDECKHCGRTHSTVWARVLIAANDHGTGGIFQCPPTQHGLYIPMAATTIRLAFSRGARVAGGEWTEEDDRALAGWVA